MIKRMALLLTALTLALTLSLGMLAVSAGEAGAAGPRDPGSSQQAAKICQEIAAEGGSGFNRGECVNFITGSGWMTGNPTRFVVGLCGFPSFEQEAVFANKGQCIKVLRPEFTQE